jgi:hypothetical protein
MHKQRQRRNFRPQRLKKRQRFSALRISSRRKILRLRWNWPPVLTRNLGKADRYSAGLAAPPFFILICRVFLILLNLNLYMNNAIPQRKLFWSKVKIK